MSGAGRRLINCGFSSAKVTEGRWMYRLATDTGRGMPGGNDAA